MNLFISSFPSLSESVRNQNRWINHFTSPANRHILPLLTSFVNVICTYDPVGYGVPYVFLFSLPPSLPPLSLVFFVSWKLSAKYINLWIVNSFTCTKSTPFHTLNHVMVQLSCFRSCVTLIIWCVRTIQNTILHLRTPLANILFLVIIMNKYYIGASCVPSHKKWLT